MTAGARGKRRIKIAAFAVTLAAGLWAGASVVRRAGPGGARDVPTFEVASIPFVRTINAEGVLKPVKTTSIKAPDSRREGVMIVFIVPDGEPVKKGDVIVRFDSGELARRLADREAEQATANSKIGKEKTLTAGSLRDRDRVASATRDELEKSKELGVKDARFFPRAEVIQSEIDEQLYTARLDHAKSARTIEEKLGRSRVDLLVIQRRLADIESEEVRKKLKALEIRAPHDGTFLFLRQGSRPVSRSGDRVFGGMKIAEVSNNDEMNAEVYVLEADAGGLAPGKSATVILDAHPDTPWKAKVTKVATFPKPEYPDNPAQYFATTLKLEGDTSALKPGQRLRASILIDERPSALVVPRQTVFRREHDTVVYRRKGERFEAVKVKLGAGTVGRLVIEDGLASGDLVALRDPTVSADEAVSAKGPPPREGAGGAAPGAGDDPEGEGPGGGKRGGGRKK